MPVASLGGGKTALFLGIKRVRFRSRWTAIAKSRWQRAEGVAGPPALRSPKRSGSLSAAGLRRTACSLEVCDTADRRSALRPRGARGPPIPFQARRGWARTGSVRSPGSARRRATRGLRAGGRRLHWTRIGHDTESGTRAPREAGRESGRGPRRVGKFRSRVVPVGYPPACRRPPKLMNLCPRNTASP